ncbi:MAG: acetate/propionate family kinase [Gemmatales bacterium]|nr:acetate/propionate family kinase [Gemmatales bacterium]MDW8388041.1 acetate/propionate family kinase [Gemmatales bacterium]
MIILVANLGSTSFKYRLFDMTDERLLARGGVERIGSAKARFYAQAGHATWEEEAAAADHAVAVEACLRFLADPQRGVLRSAADIRAIGFKAVHAHGLTGVQRVDGRVLAAMEACNDVAPAHNPPYVRAMRLLAEKLPHIPLIAAFETGFHQTIPPANRLYAVPREWAEKHGIVRHGFHGASHRFIAERTALVLGRSDLRIISCHLGGSSSLCAIRNGQSLANSLGFSPQTGLPHNNRVGDFDPFALPAIMRATGKTLEQVLDDLANRSGLLGLSGVSNDLRDIEAAAEQGNVAAREALAVFVASVRHYLGAYLVLLGGADVIVFTGGIGENSARLRSAVCEGLEWLGIVLDPQRNASAKGETPIHHDSSRVQLWTMPTNEELIVARQAKAYLAGERSP